MNNNEKKRGITPEKAQAMLSEMGITISLDKAALVLDFMYALAIFEIEQHRNSK
jgi:hypothetical protein